MPVYFLRISGKIEDVGVLGRAAEASVGYMESDNPQC